MHFGTATTPITRIVLISILAALFSACSSTAPQQSTEQPPAPVMDYSLTHTQWIAKEIFGNTADAAASTVTFPEEGRVTGSTGCNNYTGAVTVELASIDFGLLAATRKMCIPAISGQETVFLEALEASERWQRIGDTLMFMDENAEQVMTLISVAAESE